MGPIEGGICSICGERLISHYAVAVEQGELRCGLCQKLQPPFSKAAAYGSYESGLRELIHLLKYKQVRTASKAVGRMLATAIEPLEPCWTQAVTMVIPVPLDARKFWQRGNQSELIVRPALKIASRSG